MKKLLFLLILLPALSSSSSGQTSISNNLRVTAAKSLDWRYMMVVAGKSVPWTNTTVANAAIPISQRYYWMKIMVGADSANAVEYWYAGSTQNSALTQYIASGVLGSPSFNSSTRVLTLPRTGLASVQVTIPAGTSGGGPIDTISGVVSNYAAIPNVPGAIAVRGWVKAYVDSLSIARGWDSGGTGGSGGGGGGGGTGGGGYDSTAGFYAGVGDVVVNLQAGVGMRVNGSNLVQKIANLAYPNDSFYVTGNSAEGAPTFVAATGTNPDLLHFSTQQMLLLDTARIPDSTHGITVVIVAEQSQQGIFFAQYGPNVATRTLSLYNPFPGTREWLAYVAGRAPDTGTNAVLQLGDLDAIKLSYHELLGDLNAAAGSQLVWHYNGLDNWGPSDGETSTISGTNVIATPGGLRGNGRFAIGNHAGVGAGNGWGGWISHVLIFKRVLNDTERAAVFNAVKAESGAFTTQY